jgi:hypothetical protein
MSINPYFMFATGIENSYPTIRNGSDRVDEIVDRRQGRDPKITFNYLNVWPARPQEVCQRRHDGLHQRIRSQG